ncbi:hypothetical protein QBC38DRAFT_550029 [Podospora fimiseda]|uniref:Low temperature requirement A n=1 Tax=Podospora fimiseda TaxID=252190 RepID=A0AAN7BEV9_9PEZI|nr:hypothetical protein QBC38DRAFT_550029 [Podospora fimiseda]
MTTKKEHLSPEPDEDEEVESVPLMKSPLRSATLNIKQAVVAAPIETLGGWRADQDLPDFERHEEATNIEVFYDLFFAANLCVYFENQDISSLEQFGTFVAYFTLLWFNWAALGLFDVRFVTDSIFERCVRAVHFGVCVGFAVVVPTFSLYDQKAQTFFTFSIILMVSRLTLAVQYASVLWYVRKYKNTQLPLGLMVILNFVSAMTYLGVAFGFKDGKGKLFLAWYIVTALETVINIVFSLKWKTLSFEGTHLGHRMSLLTYILMGEGILTVLSSVAKVVINGNAWTSPTIGNVAAGVATLYVIYMIYYDWRPIRKMPLGRNLLWSFLHFPFHLCMKLFILGFTQFIIWWKILETNGMAARKFLEALEAMEDPTWTGASTDYYVDSLNKTVQEIFAVYTPKYQATVDSVDIALQHIKNMNITEEWWRAAPSLTEESKDPILMELLAATTNYLLAMVNSLFATFNINGISTVAEGFEGTDMEFNQAVYKFNEGKFHVVFSYAFIAAGISVFFLNLLYILSRTRGWTPFNYVRKTINFLLGLGLCLLPLIGLNPEKAREFKETPWPLPTICLVFFFILVLNHLPQPPPLFFEKDNQGPTKRPTWEIIQTLGFRNENHPRNVASKAEGQSLVQERQVNVGLPQPFGGDHHAAAAAGQQQQQQQGGGYYQGGPDSDPESQTYLAYSEANSYQGHVYQGEMVSREGTPGVDGRGGYRDSVYSRPGQGGN